MRTYSGVQQNINQLIAQAGHSLVAAKGLKYMQEQAESSKASQKLLESYHEARKNAEERVAEFEKRTGITPEAMGKLDEEAQKSDNPTRYYLENISSVFSGGRLNPKTVEPEEANNSMAEKGMGKIDQKVKFAKHIRVIKKEDM